MAGTAICCNSESLFAVMAATTGLAFFHVSHGDTPTHWAGIMATLTAKAFTFNVRVMAEYSISCLDLEGDGAGGTTVTFATVFFRCHTKSFFTIVAGTT